MLKKAVLIAAAAALLSSAADAQLGAIQGQAGVPLGVCQLSTVNLASPIKLSSCTGAWNSGAGGIPAGATYVMLQAETANVRYRDDGVAPTGSVGMLVFSGQVPFLYNGTLPNLTFISAGGSPLLDVAFYRQ